MWGPNCSFFVTKDQEGINPPFLLTKAGPEGQRTVRNEAEGGTAVDQVLDVAAGVLEVYEQGHGW